MVKGATSSMVFVGASGITLNDIESTGNPIAFRINSGTAILNRVISTGASNAAFLFENSSVVTVNTAISTTTTTGSGLRAINSSNVTCNDCIASDSAVDGFSISHSAVLTCNRCKAFNNGSTSDSSSGDGFTSHDTSTLNVRYSIAYGNYKSGVAVTGASSGEVLNSTFYNNVESTNGSGWDSGGDVGIGINATGTWTIKNNITYGHPVEFMVTAIAVAGGASVNSNYNLFYDSLGGLAFDYNGTFYNFSQFKTASGKDANSLNTNPLLQNVSSSDFYPLSSSPVIDAGISVGLTTDYSGTPVPQGSAPDIGAYEYIPPSSASSQTSLPSPPSCGDQSPGAKAPWLYGAIAQDAGSILLYFTEADNPVNKYVLEYGPTSGNYLWGVQDMGVNSRSQMTFLVQALSPNTTYYFRVRGGNGCATGPWSNEISAKTKGFISSNQRNIAQTKLKPIMEAPKDETQQNLETEPVEDYSVKIKVIDINSHPVKGAKITLHPKVQEATTDDTGVAQFSNVEPGAHRVLIAYNNYKGEEKINLTGDVIEFSLTIKVKETTPFSNNIRKLILLVITGVMFTILFFIYKIRKDSKKVL